MHVNVEHVDLQYFRHHAATENKYDSRNAHRNSTPEAGFAAQDTARIILGAPMALYDHNQKEFHESDDRSLQLRAVDYIFARDALSHFHVITPTTSKRRCKGHSTGMNVRSVNANAEVLHEADRNAQQEAKQSGDILKYWHGNLNQHGECLAICIWTNHAFAKCATGRSSHLQAVKLARTMYDKYSLEHYSLTTEASVIST
ncbi:hypothetical protein BZG36_00474 [Bifiguratus adelaidae]|uniref:Uncharacterized protein n=1 Tax=Bifiguratus adelaidae TaxID=1938954 RepID=A0A261Y7G4_9FUNG|nr:hypothetical protein BZG36_00474 [Bifiguratus adelaidae]